MVNLLGAVLLFAAPEDHLLPEASVLADPSFSDYELAVAKLLLTPQRRELQMFTMPSFRAEEVVFVVTDKQGKNIVMAARAKSQVWDAMFAQKQSEADGGAYGVGGDSDANALKKLKLERELSSAPLSTPTYEALKRVWRAALLEVRPAEVGPRGDDGETYYFADLDPGVGRLTGWVWSPHETTRRSRLVALGNAMFALARAPAAKRAALDAALKVQAEAWFK